MVYPFNYSSSNDFLMPNKMPLSGALATPATMANMIDAIGALEKELFLTRREVKENYSGSNTNAPAAPTIGDRYITGPDSVTGGDVWDNQNKAIAEWSGEEWTFVSPRVGMRVYVSGTNPGNYRYSGSAWVAVSSGGSSGPNNNFVATTNPGANDDDNQASPGPYVVGSHWVNVTLDTVYVCVDSTNGAAVWQQVSAATAGPNNNFVATTNPGVNDDVNQASPGPYVVGSLWINVTLDTAYVCVDSTDGAAVWQIVSPSASYEEGTWTPGLFGTGAVTSYTLQQGSYIKTGKHVHAQGRLVVSDMGTLGGAIYVSGLPFASHNVADSWASGIVGDGSGLAITAGTSFGIRLMPNATNMLLRLWDATGGTSGVVVANLGATPSFQFAIDYITA